MTDETNINFEVPDLTEKVLGFRAWKFEDGRLYPKIWKLKSKELLYPEGWIDLDNAWRPGINQSKCLSRRHQYPVTGCGCGLYAYHSPTRLFSWFSAFLSGNITPNIINGAIAAWGHIEVHPEGFRAEYAEPILLAYTWRQRRRVKEIAKEYGAKAVPLWRFHYEVKRLKMRGIPKLLKPQTKTRLVKYAYYFAACCYLANAIVELAEGNYLWSALWLLLAPYWYRWGKSYA